MQDPSVTIPHGLSPTAGAVLTILVLAGGQIASFVFRTLDNRRKGRARDSIAEQQVQKIGEIHEAVNGNLSSALAEIEKLKNEVAELKVAVGCPFATEKPPEPAAKRVGFLQKP